MHWLRVFSVVVLSLFGQVRYASQTPAQQVHLHEHKISQNNDTAYVRQIMRLAKSAEMRNYMRPEVDACDDFFEYACGNWPRVNPADSESPRETNFFHLLSKTYAQKQLRLLKQRRQKDDTITDGMVKDFFAACQGLRGMPQNVYKLKLRQIIEQFGHMPAMLPDDVWQEDDFDWLETIAKIQNTFGLDIILSVGIRQDFENKSLNMLFVGPPTLKLQTKSMYTDEATKWHREYYKDEIRKTLQKYLGVEERKATETAKQILDFEVNLAKGVMERKLGITLKAMSKLRTMDELQAAYEPAIDFKKFIRTVLGHELNTTIYEYMLDYQVNLIEVVKTTPKEHLANYVMYQLIQAFLYNTETSLSLSEDICLDKTKKLFAKVLDNIIFRKYNNKGTERDINLIWHKLKETFKSELESDKVNWMSLMTRKLAIEKLSTMTLEINSYGNSNFTEEFAELNITRSDYVQNVKEVLMFETKRAIVSLTEAPKPIEAAVVLSYTPAYIATENLIKIPVSLLQPNYLWSDFYPNALKFGTLGYLVAHELIHGFDDMGRNFDATGSEKNWWDANSTQAFDERKECFKHQYARYRYGGKYLPESELQSENIADNGAIQVAYSAYMKWWADAPAGEREQIMKMELLPNMHYTNKQLFFISHAQFWCNDVHEQFKDKVSLIDLHAPAKFRVIGSLVNFDEFSKAFKCARGTTMNPEHKCQIY